MKSAVLSLTCKDAPKLAHRYRSGGNWTRRIAIGYAEVFSRSHARPD